ncbi:integrase arm-type DNA-binding domain-containing protein [Lysobacter firmicutimachus]|uniref:Integrase arm-type DNA-binding domain-containing protein n=1 Tax=Lysobacter firmicutimachus TaxID=1792846 RepID=A0AAU8MTX8_9GAMM
MATSSGKLTSVAIKNAKHGPKAVRLFDGGGLYLELMPNGSKYWRLKYRIHGKEKRLAIGIYPEVPLAEAREKRDEARKAIKSGIDPSAKRQADRRLAKLSSETTFAAIAEEWLGLQSRKLAPVTYAKAEWLLGMLGSDIGQRPIAEISPPDVLAVLRKIEASGRHETAHRAKQKAGQVFRYAIATGRAERDPTADLRGALSPVVSMPRSALTKPADVAGLLRAIWGYEGQPTTAAALKLAPLLFARPGNLRAMEWGELDLENAEWRIPAGKMKMREEHVVPLAAQAIEVLTELRPLTGKRKFVFPGVRSPSRPMSENTVNAALRRLGYEKDVMTGHGFRALASTRLNEMGWAPDVIERQLAHAERNKVRAVYNRAQYLAERKKMMTAWADYLDHLRAHPESNVVPFKQGKGAQ